MGRIVFVDNAVDRSTGTIRTNGTFPNTTRRLWPGQFVNVTVTLTTIQDAITVLSLAVQVGPQRQYIYVVRPDMTHDLRPVSRRSWRSTSRRRTTSILRTSASGSPAGGATTRLSGSGRGLTPR